MDRTGPKPVAFLTTERQPHQPTDQLNQYTVVPNTIIIMFVIAFGSAMMGGRQGVVEATLHVLLQTPEHVPDEQKFDIIVLVSD